MIPASELQEILEDYADRFEERYDSEKLARYITNRTYALLRNQRPNLGALLISCGTVLEETLRKTDITLTMTTTGDFEVNREDTQECAVGSTLIEALIHFSDEISGGPNV